MCWLREKNKEKNIFGKSAFSDPYTIRNPSHLVPIKSNSLRECSGSIVLMPSLLWTAVPFVKRQKLQRFTGP